MKRKTHKRGGGKRNALVRLTLAVKREGVAGPMAEQWAHRAERDGASLDEIRRAMRKGAA